MLIVQGTTKPVCALARIGQTERERAEKSAVKGIKDTNLRVAGLNKKPPSAIDSDEASIKLSASTSGNASPNVSDFF